VLLELAATVGSDVPFFAAGAAAAVALGRGERLTPVTLAAPCALALAWPGVPLATPAVYGRHRAAPLGHGAEACAAAAAAPDAAALAALVRNDLAAAAEALCPPAARLRLELAARGALAACVSGSGSAVFGLFADRAGAAAALDGLPGSAWGAVAEPLPGARAGL
jgi:4-diphosphocytidyl-2-C-methyl-D-erythritol kinase